MVLPAFQGSHVKSSTTQHGKHADPYDACALCAPTKSDLRLYIGFRGLARQPTHAGPWQGLLTAPQLGSDQQASRQHGAACSQQHSAVLESPLLWSVLESPLLWSKLCCAPMQHCSDR